jgi:uncharacterized protein YegJ (DUF2314 family)
MTNHQDISDLLFTTGPEIEHTFTSKTGQHVYILIEAHHWGYSASAIPDNGDTIRRKFVDYTPEEIIAVLTDEIEEALSV